jgi:hypothetical protein
MPTSEIIELKEVRLSFPRLFRAKAFREGQDARFEATFLLDPSNKRHAKMIKEIKATAKALIKEKWPSGKPDNLEYCYGDADKENKKYDGYQGMFYIVTAQPEKNGRPTVCDQNRKPLVEEDGKPYAGCFVNTNITLWTQDNPFGKRIGCNLRIVQFDHDGEAFGVKPADAEEEMDIVKDDDAGIDDEDDDDLDLDDDDWDDDD